MLGKRDPQTSLFDGDQVYLDHVGRLSFYAYLAVERHHLFRDQDFVELYSARRGRPSVAPSLLCTALVLQHHDRCSDQEAAERAAYDQRWKVALGTSELERPFVKSTLQLFRAQLLVHEKAWQIFETSIAEAKRVGRLRADGKLRTALDTTAILGRGAVKDTYNLIADGIVNVMRVLARQNHEPLEKWVQRQGLERYLGRSLKGEAAIDWDNKEARRALLSQEVEDAQSVLEMARRARSQTAPGSREEERLLKASDLLSQILMQDVERNPEGGSRIREGTSGERICSVHDPEMRHGRKSASTRFDGHKLAVASDVESQLVVAVDVLAGSAKDDQGSLELAKQAATTTGLELEAALGDCAYGTGPNRERFAEAGVTLLAKVAARPETGYFSKDDFDINVEQGTCRCPAGEVTSHMLTNGYQQRADGTRLPLRMFQFSARVCGPCPLRDRCFKPSEHGRSVRLNPYEVFHQQARRWQQSADFQLFRKQRQVVEHRLARMVQLGVRQARYFGREKTLFQALMVATVANLTLLAGQTPTGRPLATLKHAVGVLVGNAWALLKVVCAPHHSWSMQMLRLSQSRFAGLRMAVSRPRL
jgi:hypothetical protein